MKKFFLLSLILISQTYSMEIRRRRHQTPTPVTMDQQTQTHVTTIDAPVSTVNAWDKCKKDLLCGAATCLGGSAACHLCVHAIAPVIDMGGVDWSMMSDLTCVGRTFVPPLCCCALSLYLYKKALKGWCYDRSTPRIYIENDGNPVLEAMLTASLINNMSK